MMIECSLAATREGVVLHQFHLQLQEKEHSRNDDENCEIKLTIESLVCCQLAPRIERLIASIFT